MTRQLRAKEMCQRCRCCHPEFPCICTFGTARLSKSFKPDHAFFVEPTLGHGVTVYSDGCRLPGTIVKVFKDAVKVRHDRGVLTKGALSSIHQIYEYFIDLGGKTEIFSKRTNGRWVRHDCRMNSQESLTLGFRDMYVDPGRPAKKSSS